MSDEYKLGASSGDGYVHAAQIAKETDISSFVSTHETDDDNVALLALKGIDGVDRDDLA